MENAFWLWFSSANRGGGGGEEEDQERRRDRPQTGARVYVSVCVENVDERRIVDCVSYKGSRNGRTQRGRKLVDEG